MPLDTASILEVLRPVQDPEIPPPRLIARAFMDKEELKKLDTINTNGLSRIL